MKKYLIVVVVAMLLGLFLDTVVNITQLPLILKGIIVILMFLGFAAYIQVNYLAGFFIMSCIIVYLLSMGASLESNNQYEFVESYVLAIFMLTLAYMRLNKSKNGGE